MLLKSRYNLTLLMLSMARHAAEPPVAKFATLHHCTTASTSEIWCERFATRLTAVASAYMHKGHTIAFGMIQHIQVTGMSQACPNALADNEGSVAWLYTLKVSHGMHAYVCEAAKVLVGKNRIE